MRRPAPGRILASLRSRLPRRRPRPVELFRRARYAAGDLAAGAWALLGRIGRAAARAWRAFWGGLSVVARRRLLAAVAALLAATAFFAFAVPDLPCEVPGGESCPPDDEAAEIVPADALAYVHVNIDPETEQFEEASEIAAALPLVSDQLVRRALAAVPAAGGTRAGFESEIAPWFGGEAAVAVIPAGAQAAEQVDLLEVEDVDGARRFGDRVVGASRASQTYREIELRVGEGGLAVAHVGGFLTLGSRAAVRGVIETATEAEGATALADDDTAERVRDRLPDHRLAEAYLSAEGVQTLIAPDRGTLGSLAPLLGPGATEGAAAALAADGDELELAVRSALDPERARSDPGFFAAFSPFEPELPERLPADSLSYVGIGDPGRTVRALLAQASAEAPGIAAGFDDLVASLRRDGELDIERELLPALGGEAAFTLAPRPGVDRAGAVGTVELPYLEFVAADVDEDRARRALAALQGPIAAGVDPAAGLQAPVFGQREIAGVEGQSLRISPAVELTHAVFDGLAVIATDPAGIAELAEGDGGLDESDGFERATEGFEDRSSMLAYLDLARLVETGERLGLAEDPAYATFAAEFRRLDLLGIQVRAEPELLATDGRLVLDLD